MAINGRLKDLAAITVRKMPIARNTTVMTMPVVVMETMVCCSPTSEKLAWS